MEVCEAEAEGPEEVDVLIVLLNPKKRSIHGWGIGLSYPLGVPADINLWNVEFVGGFNIEDESLSTSRKIPILV